MKTSSQIEQVSGVLARLCRLDLRSYIRFSWYEVMVSNLISRLETLSVTESLFLLTALATEAKPSMIFLLTESKNSLSAIVFSCNLLLQLSWQSLIRSFTRSLVRRGALGSEISSILRVGCTAFTLIDSSCTGRRRPCRGIFVAVEHWLSRCWSE